MALRRAEPITEKFNRDIELPYSLRIRDFELAMQDIYDFFFDVNSFLSGRGLHRLEDTLRKAALSGLISDMLTASLARHSRVLTENKFHNGHPDLIIGGMHPNDAAQAAQDGVEIKTTSKPGGAADTHGARDQYMCAFVYDADHMTQPAVDREPTVIKEIYLGYVRVADFRQNNRGQLGTRTATLHAAGIKRLRQNWVYYARP